MPEKQGGASGLQELNIVVGKPRPSDAPSEGGDGGAKAGSALTGLGGDVLRRVSLHWVPT